MTSLELHTQAGCGLAIGRYPRFRYDARGGSGRATCSPVDDTLEIAFAPAELSIPPLNWRTTRVLGLPLPPGLQITIEPLTLAGQLVPASGAVTLRFEARFHCSWGGLYQPPPLLVSTDLTTGSVAGQRHRAEGTPLDASGQGCLVGVARVPPSGDRWLDGFLGLPDDALAVLRCGFGGLEGERCPMETHNLP